MGRLAISGMMTLLEDLNACPWDLTAVLRLFIERQDLLKAGVSSRCSAWVRRVQSASASFAADMQPEDRYVRGLNSRTSSVAFRAAPMTVADPTSVHSPYSASPNRGS